MRQRDGVIAYDVTSGVPFVRCARYFVWKSTGITLLLDIAQVAPELNYLF